MIPGVLDRVPHWVPCREAASPSACLSVSLMNKSNLLKKKEKKQKELYKMKDLQADRSGKNKKADWLRQDHFPLWDGRVN